MVNRKQPKKQRSNINADTVSEKKLETLVCVKAKDLKYRVLKFYSKVDTGWMDRILLSPTGITIWVEFKKPTGRLKALQKINRNWLVANDHYYFLLDTYEKCTHFIDHVLPLFK